MRIICTLFISSHDEIWKFDSSGLCQWIFKKNFYWPRRSVDKWTTVKLKSTCIFQVMLKIWPKSNFACKFSRGIPRFVTFCAVSAFSCILMLMTSILTNSWKTVATRNGETIIYGLEEYCNSTACFSYPKHTLFSGELKEENL